MPNIFNDTNSNYLRKTTAAGLAPLLLAQILIALFCVPETLQGGTEIRREVAWEELYELLSGEKKVTVLLSEGGAVRSEGATALSDSIHLSHIVMATNSKRYAWGSEASIANDSVKGIRLENMRGFDRIAGPILGGAGAFGLARLMFILKSKGAYAVRDEGRAATIYWSTLVCAPVAGAVLGHWLGQRSDRETTIITIID